MRTSEPTRGRGTPLFVLFLPLLAACGDPSFSPSAPVEPGLEQIQQEVERHHAIAVAAISLEEMRVEMDRYEIAVGEGLEVLRDEVTDADCQREIPAMLSMADGLLGVVAAHHEAIDGAAVLADAKANCMLHHDAMLARIEQLDEKTERCGAEVEARAND